LLDEKYEHQYRAYPDLHNAYGLWLYYVYYKNKVLPVLFGSRLVLCCGINTWADAVLIGMDFYDVSVRHS
jgi:hypothetical protein